MVLLDAPEHNRWPALLSLGEAIFGRLDWWPAVPAGRRKRAGQRIARRAAASRWSALESA